MEKKPLILLILCFIFLIPLFSGFYFSHDSITHLGRAAFYESAIRDGQFPPRWAADANFGHGSPFFIFYYPLSGYAIALLHIVGFSFENSYLLICIFTFLLGVFGFYKWISISFDKKTAFLATFFYTILPYKFLTLYIRGGIGEFMSFSLLPFFFYFIEKFKEKSTVFSIVFGAVIYALIMLSHNAIALIFTPIFLAYAFLGGKRKVVRTIISIALGLFLSSYFWIPALFESKYTGFSSYFGQMYREHFPSFLCLIYSPVGFGPDVNKPGGLSPQIGIPAFLIFALVVIWLIKKRFKKEKLKVIFWLVLFVLGVFISTHYSELIWQQSQFLQKFQFPWRFVVIPSFAVCVLFAHVIYKVKKYQFIWMFLIFSMIFGLLILRVDKHLALGDKYYYNYPGSTYFHNEATTIWSAGDPSKKAKSQIEFAQGEGRISNLVRKTALHAFHITSSKPVIIVDNTIYFPGWKAYVNGKEVPIQFQDQNHRGLITFPVPDGVNTVTVRFEETKIRLVSDFITLLAILFSIAILIYGKVRNR